MNEINIKSKAVSKSYLNKLNKLSNAFTNFSKHTEIIFRQFFTEWIEKL